MQLRIVPYTLEDNEEALALEKTCPQGDALMLRFRRPTFHARSTVYEHSVILCAKEGERLVGIAAGALKQVMLHGRMVRALYGYDLRVHPDWRRYGTARKLPRRSLMNCRRRDASIPMSPGRMHGLCNSPTGVRGTQRD